MTKASRWRVAEVVVVGLFMAILDTTIVSVTLPQMQKAFHTDFESISWVASCNAYLGHPFEKKTLWPVIASLFHPVWCD